MVKILCDSACDLSADIVKKYNIRVLPCHVLLGETDYLDGVTVTPDQIFAYVKQNGILPKTSALTPLEVASVFVEELKDSTEDEIICFAMSSGISSTYNNMRIAAEDTDEKRITVVDSRSLTTALGMLVIESAVLAQRGADRQTILDHVEEIKGKIHCSFVVDTLKYLYMGGRCSAFGAFAGTSLNLHPMVQNENGVLTVKKKYIGSIDRCVMKYADEIEKNLRNASTERIFLTTSMPDGSPTVEKLKNRLQAMGLFGEVFCVHAGSLISSHCGPGCLGIIYREK